MVRVKIRFQIPWMRLELSHLMYQDLGYLCRTSLLMVDMGSNMEAPTETASEKLQHHRDIL